MAASFPPIRSQDASAAPNVIEVCWRTNPQDEGKGGGLGGGGGGLPFPYLGKAVFVGY